MSRPEHRDQRGRRGHDGHDRPVLRQAPVINTEQSDFSTNINQTAIANLPTNTRRWSTFALMTPGAAPDGNFGLVSTDGVREFQVTTSNYSAEYGSAAPVAW